MQNELLKKIIGGAKHASTVGMIAFGSGQLNIVDLDFVSILVLVVISVLYNALQVWLKAKA